MKTVIYLLTSCFFIIATIVYMNFLLQYRTKNRWSIWLTALLFLCVTTVSYFSDFSPVLNTVLFFAMLTSFGCFFSNWKRIAVVISFLVAALFISETMVFYTVELINSSPLVNMSEEQIMEWCSTAPKLVIPLFLYYFAKIFSITFSKEALPAQYLVGCLSIPFLSVFIFHYIYSSNKGDNIPLHYSLLVSIIIISLNIIMFSIFIRLTEYYDAKIANYKYIEQIDAFNRQQLNDVNNITAVKQVSHDLNSILLAVKINLEGGDMRGALDAINHHIQEANPAYYVSNTSIYPIDSIINYKNEIARQAGININVSSRNVDGIDINWTDVCVIMSSALDNAIEACKRIKNSEEKSIRIVIETQNQMLRITISNPFTGKLLTSKQGKYLSVKSDKENHGYGISGIMRLLEKNNGIGHIENKDNLFVLTAIVPEKQQQQRSED